MYKREALILLLALVLVGVGYAAFRFAPVPSQEIQPIEDPQTWLPSGIVESVEGGRITFAVRELKGPPSDPNSWVETQKSAVISQETEFRNASGGMISVEDIVPGALIQVLTSEYPHDKSEFAADTVTLIH